MCGIVGYIGQREASEILVEGLEKLEYRGYDSSGLAVLSGNQIELRRSVGKLRELRSLLKDSPLTGGLGIGHTRWATHGRPTEENAHPHFEDGVAVVHNGIIENYLKVRAELKNEGAVFKSETDTEILSHLIAREIKKGLELEKAVRAALSHVKGSYALAVLSEKEPNRIIGARMECPLIVGLGENEAFIGSDVLAMLNVTRQAIFLEDGDIVTLEKNKVTISDHNGESISRAPRTIDWTPAMAEKCGYRHFMQKEIFEQPQAITDTFRGVVMEEEGDIFLNDFNIPYEDIERIYVIGCGTSWHAGLVGKFLIEEHCGIPTEVDLASEFRYRNPLVTDKTLVIAISQSGETADTLAAVREAKSKGARVLGICNVIGSSLTREADYSFMTHAGPEIGVASTKAFTTQLVAVYVLALYFGRRLGSISKERGVELVHDLMEVPSHIERALEGAKAIEKIAKDFFHNTDFLYMGRGINYPIALEGALKLKEISYIHAEGYPAGEMKHGPIALIDEDMPVVVLAPRDQSFHKILSNVEEVKARGARVIALVDEGETEATDRVDEVIEVPAVPRHTAPIVLSIPLQLLAYHIAVLKGTDVDQPRNLAKSVTVE